MAEKAYVSIERATATSPVARFWTICDELLGKVRTLAPMRSSASQPRSQPYAWRMISYIMCMLPLWRGSLEPTRSSSAWSARSSQLSGEASPYMSSSFLLYRMPNPASDAPYQRNCSS